MKILSALLAFCLLVSGMAPFASAQEAAEVLSLPQLLQELRSANPDLLAARKRLEAAQAKIPQAKGLPPPRIGVEFEELPRGTFKVNQATVLYSLLQSLPFPGKLSLRQKVAVKEAQMAGMMFKRTEWELTSMLKEVYYNLFLVDRELEIQQEQVAWLNQAAAAASARYATGAASQTELLRAQTEALEASNMATVLTHRRQAMAAHLNHLLNQPGHAPVGHPGPVSLLEVPFSPEALFAQAMEEQPELLVFRFSAERAEAAWKLSKRELLPDLETIVELRDPAMGPFGPWDLTLALVLPFWFWTKQKYGVKAALYDKDSALAAYQGMQNEIQRRLHEHWHEAKAAYATALVCQEGLIPRAKQAVTSALASYTGGRGSFMELMDTLVALKERQRTYVQHLVALEQHIVMLEQSVGVPLRAAHQAEAGGAASFSRSHKESPKEGGAS
ncbi:MAG: TolC family protein [Candidatus Omnitrophica bacterium]|nr:TolC family protein [Candidatus Omnitrophota bacterium]